MNETRWMLRMAKWARNPPSAKMVKLVLGIIVVCAILYAVERFVGWPDFLTQERVRRPRFEFD